jgi:hypothetical protein
VIEKLYNKVLARFPFEGTITGRTANTLTVDLGLGVLRQGDDLEIARIVSIQRHPLLGAVVGTDYVRTGRAKVTTVDRVLSFAEVQEEAQGEKISPGQKILKSHLVTMHEGKEEAPAPEGRRPKEKTEKRTKEADPLDEERLKGDFDHFRPRYGRLGAGLGYGSLGHSQSVGGAISEYSGTGLSGELSGELWITKNWIFSAAFGFQNATLSGPNNVSVGDTSLSDIAISAGFRIFPDSVTEGVALTGSLGYESMSFRIPDNSALSLGGRRYGGISLRAEADIAFLEKQKINIGLNLLPFASVTELGSSLGTPNKGTLIGGSLGWNRQLAEAIWLRIGARYDVANASYDDSSTSVTDKRFTIGPGIYCLF